MPARSRSRWLRPKRVLLIVLGVIVFLAISTALARWLSVENLERDEDLRADPGRGPWRPGWDGRAC